MILVDANLLIYAVNEDLPDHPTARAWLEERFSSTQPLGLAAVVILAFVRITTRPGLFDRPLSVDQAVGYVDSWLEQPCVRWVSSGDRHWPIFVNLLRSAGTGGNLTSDAHLAALAIEHGYAIASADRDFQRFPGLRVVNPLAGRPAPGTSSSAPLSPRR